MLMGFAGLVAMGQIAAAPQQRAALTAGERQIRAWLDLLETNRADAEAMIVGQVTYRVGVSNQHIAVSKRVFLDLLAQCKAGAYVNMMMPDSKDGTVTRSFRLKCPDRAAGVFKAGDY